MDNEFYCIEGAVAFSSCVLYRCFLTKYSLRTQYMLFINSSNNKETDFSVVLVFPKRKNYISKKSNH